MNTNCTVLETAEEAVHPVYLPFTTSQLRQHFAPVARRSSEELERHIQYFTESASRYTEFRNQYPSRHGRALKLLKFPCQTEKDERFWAASCWLTIFYDPNRVEILSTLMKDSFGEQCQIPGIKDWQECFCGELHLYFEAQLPSPRSYKEWLSKNMKQRNLIPYVIEAASRQDDDYEGPTHVDAILLNADNGFAILIEAKVASDISCGVSFDLMRNQLARTVDVSLESNPKLPYPLSSRRADRTLILLQTPEMFRNGPHSRLYGWLMNAYRLDSAALHRDLPHRQSSGIREASKRLGWLTWEDCCRVLPSSCKWLSSKI